MFNKIKRLGVETGIYGISTILGRFLNFLLVPFYTNILVPSDYGIVTYVYSLIAFVNVVYGYGMESSYMRYSSAKEIGSDAQNFSTPFISHFLTSSVLTFVLVLAAPSVAGFVGLPERYDRIIDYSAWILLFDTLSVVPFASLRMERKAKLFATLKSLNIAINVACNLVLLLVFRAGVEGIFMSGMISSGATLFMLLPTIGRQFTKEFSPELFRGLLKFGLPYVPAGLASMMIQVVDRPILRMLTDDATVGIYQAGYRLGIFMMLVVSMYDYAWRPFFLTHAKEPNAKELFARVLTYFFLFMAGVFLTFTFFIPDIVRTQIFGRYIIHPEYWSGLGIVPIVMLGYVFLGISNNMVAGIYIEKKTQYLPLTTFTGAVVNVVANLLLIPRLGIFGAAWATFLSYAAMAVLQYFIVQRFYSVSYEWGRLLKISTACGAASALYFLVGPDGWNFVSKLGLLLLFILLVYLMKFLRSDEMSFLKTLLRRTEVRPQDRGDTPSNGNPGNTSNR
jgi:O-antigen/teichoic acid export membrane protein